ncbi:flagellar basal body-associated protein FliL [Ketogulonicigenium robustum]|uniref:Flagellar protein FliL n=1 Tax=Ketogulonicigenium robustum TaxID=92947 RepID=A0A1W6P1N1_9RHOB|nr:flagellar basal body-associated FliL family protein [Ketogulonicigenium robustum]ARO15422.1 flagellar basal body-associated protein FliL [Ketogulonicigenium robustum]
MVAMADADLSTPKGRGRKAIPLILGLVLALAGAGGGYLAVSQGLLPWQGRESTHEGAVHVADNIAFVAMEPLIVNLPVQAGGRYLRFTAQLEVPADSVSAVNHVMPRITDVLNGYLRAVTPADLSDASGMMRMRGMMLRRVQAVAGEGNVRNILIMELVVN